jgi:hypothetical protein
MTVKASETSRSMLEMEASAGREAREAGAVSGTPFLVGFDALLC